MSQLELLFQSCMRECLVSLLVILVLNNGGPIKDITLYDDDCHDALAAMMRSHLSGSSAVPGVPDFSSNSSKAS